MATARRTRQPPHPRFPRFTLKKGQWRSCKRVGQHRKVVQHHDGSCFRLVQAPSATDHLSPGICHRRRSKHRHLFPHHQPHQQFSYAGRHCFRRPGFRRYPIQRGFCSASEYCRTNTALDRLVYLNFTGKLLGLGSKNRRVAGNYIRRLSGCTILVRRA